jgi:hypothetical protein
MFPRYLRECNPQSQTKLSHPASIAPSVLTHGGRLGVWLRQHLAISNVQGLLIVVSVHRTIYIAAEQSKGADAPARLAAAAAPSICAHSALINGCHSHKKQSARPHVNYQHYHTCDVTVWPVCVADALGDKPVTMPLRPSQTPHGLNWNRTRASEVRYRRFWLCQ